MTRAQVQEQAGDKVGGFLDEFTAPVAKPEWMDDALDSSIKSFQLARDGRIPEKIKSWMLVTACLRVLRSVYGDDLATCIKLRERVLASAQRVQDAEIYYSKIRGPR